MNVPETCLLPEAGGPIGIIVTENEPDAPDRDTEFARVEMMICEPSPQTAPGVMESWAGRPSEGMAGSVGVVTAAGRRFKD